MVRAGPNPTLPFLLNLPVEMCKWFSFPGKMIPLSQAPVAILVIPAAIWPVEISMRCFSQQSEKYSLLWMFARQVDVKENLQGLLGKLPASCSPGGVPCQVAAWRGPLCLLNMCWQILWFVPSFPTACSVCCCREGKRKQEGVVKKNGCHMAHLLIQQQIIRCKRNITLYPDLNHLSVNRIP